jgi:hypothetical protein
MQKNVVVACGLGDLFTFLTRLDNFFENNKEYTSIRFWTWLHSPDLAKELVDLDHHDVEVFSLEDMTRYLEETIPESQAEHAKQFFIKQNRGGVGVDKYLQFIQRFFPNLEQWVYLPVYDKYTTTFPYKMANVTPTVRENPYIVVHPYSTTVKTEKEERKWSPKRWGHLIKLINNYYGKYDVIIIGTNKDKIEGPHDFPRGTVDLRGKTTLTEAISLIYGASAVAGTNSWSTLISTWAEIPTYVQWFVQHQLIPTHNPKPITDLKHVLVEATTKGNQITTAEAWEGLRTLFDATIDV